MSTLVNMSKVKELIKSIDPERRVSSEYLRELEALIVAKIRVSTTFPSNRKTMRDVR